MNAKVLARSFLAVIAVLVLVTVAMSFRYSGPDVSDAKNDCEARAKDEYPAGLPIGVIGLRAQKVDGGGLKIAGTALPMGRPEHFLCWVDDAGFIISFDANVPEDTLPPD